MPTDVPTGATARSVTLDEIAEIAARLPPPDLAATTAVLERARRLAKPADGLGRLEALAGFVAGWQHRSPPVMRHPRIALFAAAHGVASAEGVLAPAGQDATARVALIRDGRSTVGALARVADSDLRVYELDVEHPTADMRRGPAMAEEDCARAMAYGMMAVDQGLHVVGLSDVAPGNRLAAAAIGRALFAGPVAAWVDAGAGAERGDAPARQAAVEAALDANATRLNRPTDILAALGGYEIAAIAGAIVAARLARTPVVLDSPAGAAAAAILHGIDRRAIDHCLFAHALPDPAHRRLLEAMGREPLFDFGVTMAEGVGAALAIPLIRAAVDAHDETGELRP